MNRIAAIDLGSNALRFVIAELDAKGRFKFLKKLREPVRLGDDVFTRGVISPQTEAKALTAFKKFKTLIERYEVRSVKAVATSATRDADNGAEFVANVKKQTGIRLHIIDGIEEAHLIHLAVRNELDLNKKNVLLIDIGGGSVEVTFSEGNHLTASESFKMGTIRLLEQMNRLKLTEDQVDIALEHFAEPLKLYIMSKRINQDLAFAVGTGGNFETLGRLKLQLLGKAPNTYVEASELQEIREKLITYSFAEKVSKLGLKKDRADVIVPALAVTELILADSEVDRLYIPYVGLKDGILWQAVDDLQN